MSHTFMEEAVFCYGSQLSCPTFREKLVTKYFQPQEVSGFHASRLYVLG